MLEKYFSPSLSTHQLCALLPGSTTEEVTSRLARLLSRRFYLPGVVSKSIFRPEIFLLGDRLVRSLTLR